MSGRTLIGRERSFGVSVGSVLCALGLLLVWRGRLSTAVVAGFTGAALVVLGLTAPRLLKWPAALWWRFAMLLGHVSARIWLTVLFAVVVVPVSVLWRMVGKDPLARRRDRAGWEPCPTRYRDPRHFAKMY